MSRQLLATLFAATSILSAGCSDGESTASGSDEDSPPAEVDLAAPGPEGWQFKTGSFDVPIGEEVQDCYFFEVPFDEPTYVRQITIAQSDGSHHMNVFRVRTAVQLDAEPGERVVGGECWNSANWADWPLISNSQKAGVEDWSLPEGVALRFEPREKIMLQTHYVNAQTQATPVAGEVFVNFHRVAEAEVESELGTVFATNQGIEVCPGDTQRRFEASCLFGKDEPVTISAANGHFHSRGRRFTMNTYDPDLAASGEQFYENLSWDDPAFDRDLGIVVPPGHGLSWACEFSAERDECGDPDNDCCFTFGGYVEYQEHCNAFVYYYPRGETDINCF